MIWNLIKDFWLLFGRLFPFPTKSGLRRIGTPDRTSPVLLTCNFELTVRKVTETLKKNNIDAWLLVAPTKGINVWCGAGAGHLTADTVVSIIRTSGIEEMVAHREIILPQLSATGINIWTLKKRTGWKPCFGPADINNIPAYLLSGQKHAEREHRLVKFNLKDRFIMGTNFGFNTLLLLILPLLIASIWINDFWWKSIPLLFALSVLSSILIFRLPGKPGIQKGFSLGIFVSVPFILISRIFLGMDIWTVTEWALWTLLLSVYLGYDMPSWSPLWRADVKELVLGVKNTHIEVIPERCINCGLCSIVCPMDVFANNDSKEKPKVQNLDNCQACGACIRNCPAEALANNFTAGLCSCPTCTIINSVGALKQKLEKTEEPEKETSEESGCCDSKNCKCD